MDEEFQTIVICKDSNENSTVFSKPGIDEVISSMDVEGVNKDDANDATELSVDPVEHMDITEGDEDHEQDENVTLVESDITEQHTSILANNSRNVEDNAALVIDVDNGESSDEEDEDDNTPAQDTAVVTDTGANNVERIVIDDESYGKGKGDASKQLSHSYIDVEQPESSLVIDESSNDKESNASNSVGPEEKLKDSQGSLTESTSSQGAMIQTSPNIKIPVKRKSKVSDATMSPELREKYSFPFKHGWKREVVQRNVTTGKKSQRDIYYFAPTGKKLRSMVEIENWLSDHGGPVKIGHFSFARMPISEPPFETVRDAGKSRRNPNNSLIDNTPSPKRDPMKRVIKRKEFMKSIHLQRKTKEGGFKSILSTPLFAANKNKRPASSSLTGNKGSPSSHTGPKIKYVPKVDNTKILTSLLKSKNNKVPGRSFLKKAKPRSPDWILPNSDSENEREKPPIRKVEVIKYGVSGQATTGGSNEDELQNVLGTPSKLISSIVNPEPPPPPKAPVPFNLDNVVVSSPTGTMRFQVIAKKDAKPQEVIAQLGLNNMKYRFVNPSENIKDNRVVLIPQENQAMRNIPQRPIRPGMPNLQPKPQTIIRPITQSIILPPPPPLAFRPNLSRPVIGSSVSGSLLPPLHRPVSVASLPSGIVVQPKLQQTTVVRLNNPPPPLQSFETISSSLHVPIIKSIDSNQPSATTSICKTQPSSSTTPKSNRSSTPELVDKIFYNLPDFLSMNLKNSRSSNHSSSSSFPSTPQASRFTISSGPDHVGFAHHSTPERDVASDHLNSNKNRKSFFDYEIKQSNFVGNEKVSGDASGRREDNKSDDAEANDSDNPDNEDSMLPISFSQWDDSDKVSNSVTRHSSSTDGNMCEERRGTDSPLSVESSVSEPGKEKESYKLNGVSVPQLSRKEFFAFKLVQDNFPAMLTIFGHLPMYDLLRVGGVCKLWYQISRMNILWQKLVIKSVFLNHWHNAVKFFIKVGVTSLTILELPDKGKEDSVDHMIKALSRMTQLKELQFSTVPQQIIIRLMETMPHLQNVGAEFIVDAEPMINRSGFSWSTMPKEFAMAKAVDAILDNGVTVTEAASMCSVNEAELKHLMLNDQSALRKQEEDVVLLCCMRLSRMGFLITLPFIEKRMEEEISKRPEPCQPTPNLQKLSCYRLLKKNQHLFEIKLPYHPSDSVPKKLLSYSRFVTKLYQDAQVKSPTCVLAFVMKKFSVLNPAGNRVCNVTALSLLSAANIPIPTMLIFPNVVHYPENISNLILVGSKDGLPTPNMVTHYLRAIFSEIKMRPLVIFFNGHENVLSDQLISECINSSIFVHCVPPAISSIVFPGCHGGVLNSISKNFNDSFLRVKEKDFIELMCREMKMDSQNRSQMLAFAKTGIYPVKARASIELYYLLDPDARFMEMESENSEEMESDHSAESENEYLEETNNNKDDGSLLIRTLKNDQSITGKENSSIVGDFRNVPNFSQSSIQSLYNANFSNVSVLSSAPSLSSQGRGLTAQSMSKQLLRSRISGRGRAGNSTWGSVNKDKGNISGGLKKAVLMNGSGDLKRQDKRPINAMDEAHPKNRQGPAKKLKENEQKVSSVESIGETIDEVIARSREEYETREKELNQAVDSDSDNGSADSNSKESEETPVRPSLKIKLSSQGFVSILNNDKNSNDKGGEKEDSESEEEVEMSEDEEQGGDTESQEEEEEDSKDEEEESSSKEMKTEDDNEDDDDNKENKKYKELKDKLTVIQKMEKEEEFDVSSDVSEQEVEEISGTEGNGNGEEVKSSSLLDADSEPETSVKVGRKVKKKKKKKHKHRLSREAKESNLNDSDGKLRKQKKKKRKKKKKNEEILEEEMSREVSSLDISISGPHEESVSEVVEEKVDEGAKKIEFMRRVSMADHDYETKFDSDSGTEVALEDSVHEINMDFENVKPNGENMVENKEVESLDAGVEVKSVETEGVEMVSKKGETSDSDSSSSDTDSGSNSDSSSSSVSGSSSSSKSSSGSSSSNESSSDKEDVEEISKLPGKDVNNSKSDVEKNKGDEQSDSAESSSSSVENSTSSDSDSGDEVEDGNNVEEDDEEEEEDDGDDEEEEQDEDSKCQLCMLSNPPHSKDVVINWVDCDGNCGRWFHVICVTRSQPKINPEHYVCPSCRCKR